MRAGGLTCTGCPCLCWLSPVRVTDREEQFPQCSIQLDCGLFFPAQFKNGRRFVLMLCFPFIITAAAVDFVVVFRDGDKATLSCGNAGGSCENIDWLFADTSQRAAVSLVKRGKVCQDGGTEPYRLSVKNHCSLEIMNVTVKDVGQYTCRPYWTNSDYARVQLSVVTCKYHYTYILTIYSKYSVLKVLREAATCCFGVFLCVRLDSSKKPPSQFQWQQRNSGLSSERQSERVKKRKQLIARVSITLPHILFGSRFKSEAT